jgi:signal transduction histidine kinase
MRASRLRLRIAGWFALAMLLGLGLLDVGLFTLLGRRADARLRGEVLAAARGAEQAVLREADGPPRRPLAQAAREALDEWPAGSEALLVLGPNGEPLARRGADALLKAIPPVNSLPAAGHTVDLPFDEEGKARLAVARDSGAGAPTVVAVRSTAALKEDLETLAAWLALSVPLVLLVSLPCGYLLARRALSPFQSLAAELDAMRPDALDRRLPVADPPDELDQLASQVNHLLDRLASSQQQTRRFLAQAAHQLRTPLTLIRGESDLAIDRPREPTDYRAALDRVSRAASQMSRRVDELFLLARAEAGERIAVRAPVEVDAVALEAVDLMRGRAQALHRQLSLGTMDGIEVSGEEGLLREAALELLENACRHGEATPIVVSVTAADGHARLEVASGGPPAVANDREEGLGLAIVRWIAAAHGGALVHTHEGGMNRFALILPTAAPGSAT